jgi:hypothetical protein
MIRFRHFSPALLALCVLSVQAQERASGLLRVDWQPGKSYIWETTTESTTKVTGKEQRLTIQQRTEMDVTPLADGGKQVRVTFGRTSGKMQGDGGKAEFDTDKPWDSDHDLREAVARNVGRSFIMIYDAKNRYLEARGLDEMTGAASGGPVLSAMADAKAVANLFRKSMEMGLPPMPVELGETWSADETLEFPQAGETHVHLDGKYTSQEMFQERNHARINFEGKIKTTEQGKVRQAGDYALTENSKLSGVVLFDLERSVISLSVSTAQLEIKAGEDMIKFDQKVSTKLSAVQDVRRAIPLEDDEALNKE